MKRKHVSKICGLFLGMLILCACSGEEEEETAVREHVREERTVEKEEENVKEEPEEPVEEPGDKAEDERDELLEKVLKKSGASEDEVQVFEYDDFDRDGAYEAFVLIGEQMEDYGDGPVVEGKLWFVSADKCEMLRETAGMGYRNAARTMEIGGTTYVMFDEIYVTEAVTKVWYVSDGAKVAPFSNCGNVVEPTEKDRFCIMDSSYDAFVDQDMGVPTGHTWKYYYFFYNSEKDEVNEYAGTTIDADTVTYLCGRDLLAEIMSDSDIIESIFCRGNGYIVINYRYDDAGTTTYEHYIYDFLNDHYVDDYGQELDEAEAQLGFCAQSLCPDIASYPEGPGPDDMVWYGE